MARQYNVQVYFDSDEQRKALAHRAVDEGMSMSALAKRILIQTLDLPVFLPQMSEETDERQSQAA